MDGTSQYYSGSAYYEYIKALNYTIDYSRESLLQARDYLNNGIIKEPDWAPLYSGMAQV